MKRWILSFLMAGLVSVGILRAEYNVGDSILVPLNQYYLIPIRDYPLKIGTNQYQKGVVKYKDDNLYIIVIDSIKYPFNKVANDIVVPDSLLVVFDQDVLDSTISAVVNMFSDPYGDGSGTVLDHVLQYLNLNRNVLYDSDNEDRIYLVITGFYLSSSLPFKVKGYFDPYFSTTTDFPRHEYFVLNTKDLDLKGETDYIDVDVLRKILFDLASTYVLWSLDPEELDVDLKKSAFYLASKVDTLYPEYYKGYNKAFSINAPVDPFSIFHPYLIGKYVITDLDAEATYLLYRTYEQMIGEDSLLQIILSPNYFQNDIKLALESRGYTIADVLSVFHLNNMFNEANLGGYGYNDPALAGMPIYVKQYFGVTPTFSNSRYFISSRKAAAVYAKLTYQSNVPLTLNYRDSAISNGEIKVYMVDEVAGTVDEINNVDRYFRPEGLDRYTQYLYIVNLTPGSVPFAVSLDTIPPADYSFRVITDRFDLTRFDIVLLSADQLVEDVDKDYLFVQLKAPMGVYDVEVPLVDSLVLGTSKKYVYQYSLKLPRILEGDYIFVTTPKDLVGNVGITVADTITVAYLNGIFAASDKVLLKGDGRYVAFNFDENGVFVAPSGDGVEIAFRVPSSTFSVYYSPDGEGNWIRLNSIYSEGYVHAEVSQSGYYRVDVGNAGISNMQMLVQGNRLVFALPEKGELSYRIYDVSGRLIYGERLEVNPGIYASSYNLKRGVYVIAVDYNDKSLRKKVVVY